MTDLTPQAVSAETAQRLLSRMLAAQEVIQWLENNKMLSSDQSVESLARLYAGGFKQERDFLNQFVL